MHGGRPILLVSRDADDVMWQFLTGGSVEMADAMIVSLREVYRIDPSIGGLDGRTVGPAAALATVAGIARQDEPSAAADRRHVALSRGVFGRTGPYLRRRHAWAPVTPCPSPIVMHRTFLVIAATATLLASLANPHFIAGGAYDVYGFAPWWQQAGAFLCLAAVVVAAVMVWRGSANYGLMLFGCELLLYLSLTAGSALYAGRGHFSNGWGGSFLSAFYVAVGLRLILLYLAYRETKEARTLGAAA